MDGTDAPGILALMARDRALVALQNKLLNFQRFDEAFAERLEAITPRLQHRAQRRREDDMTFCPTCNEIRFPRSPSIIPRDGTAQTNWIPPLAHLRVRLPRRWLFEDWTDERVRIFYACRAGISNPSFVRSLILTPSWPEVQNVAPSSRVEGGLLDSCGV